LALSGFFSTDLPAGVSLPRPPEQIDQIADLFKRETYQKDDIICSQGDPGDSMYVIRSGIVSVFKEVAGQEIYVSDLKRCIPVTPYLIAGLDHRVASFKGLV